MRVTDRLCGVWVRRVAGARDDRETAPEAAPLRGFRGRTAGRAWLRCGAFSLIELLVVIVIISILVALLFPALLAAREHGRRVAARAEMWEIQKAWTVYYKTYERLPSYSEMTPVAVDVLSGTGGSDNPLRIKFMDFDRRDFTLGMRDPWGRRYQLDLTDDPDAVTTRWSYQTRAYCQNAGRDNE